MRDEYKVIILSFLTAIAFWLTDVVLDPAFHKTPYAELVIYGGSSHDLLMRVLTLFLILGSGLLSARYVARHRNAEEELRKTSAYLDSILKSAREYAISTTDSAFRIKYYNPVAAKLHGYSPIVLGRTVEETGPMDCLGGLGKAREAVLKNGEYTCTVEKKTPDGVRHIESRISGIFDDGELIGFANFSRDITDERLSHAEREELIRELQEALAEVKTLSGLLPICSYCKKIRDDKGYWSRIETYIARHSAAQFTHSICPDCEKKALEE